MEEGVDRKSSSMTRNRSSNGYYAPSVVVSGDAEDQIRGGSWSNYYDRLDAKQNWWKAVNKGKAVRHIKMRFVASILKKKSEPQQLQEASPNTKSWMVLKILLLDPINILLLAAPVGIAAAIQDWGPAAVFAGCFLGLVPLAKLLGDSTEHLAENLNQTIGGLLNATFGNAVEMIVTLSAIQNGLLDVVKHSLVGSMLSNLLLVLGMAFFAGGLRHPEQRFPGAAALINITMLLVGTLSFLLPTIFAFTAPQGETLAVSRLSAIFVGIGYCAYLFFQLYTHVEVFEDKMEDEEQSEEDVPHGEAEAVMGVPWALGLLIISTVAVSFLSEYMVASIEGIVLHCKISKAFVGCILVPIVGNACEHASAVRMAYNNKVAAAIAVAVGSSTQISLLVMPFAVLMGWAMNQPLDLNLAPLGLSVVFLSVMVVFSIVTDGRSNWLEGFMLMLAYCLVAILYWFLPDSTLSSE